MGGRGSVRRKVMSGTRVGFNDTGNGESSKSGPFGGAPEEPSATSLVKSCASFFAPVSTSRAYATVSEGVATITSRTYGIP